jgi:hypothetical protein
MIFVSIESLRNAARECRRHPTEKPFLFVPLKSGDEGAVFAYPSSRRNRRLQLFNEPKLHENITCSKQISPIFLRYAGAFGNGPTIPLLVRFLANSRDLSFELLMEEKRSCLLGKLFELMFIHATLISSQPLRGFVALRSHADALFYATGKPNETRAKCDAEFHRIEASLCSLARGIMNGSSKAAQFSGWGKIITDLRRRSEYYLSCGALRYPQSLSPSLGELSNYGLHRSIAMNPEFQSFMLESPAFLVTRLIANALYVFLTQVGITQAEKMLLCHLVARTAETELGVDPEKLVKDFRLHDSI